MISKELLQKIKALEIRTRHVVNAMVSGQYQSVFKGQGISFSEVREYNYGDDVRFIDWKVTAKTGKPHIKRFEEERELTVIIMVDISGSLSFGSDQRTKRDIVAEISAVLGFSAICNKDKVGLVLFTDQVEVFIPPKKGKNHMLHILRDIYTYRPVSKLTSIRNALSYLLTSVSRKAVVFLISDFMSDGYSKQLQIVAKKHDFVPVIIEDPRECALPNSGIVALEDEETGEILYLNSGLKKVRDAYSQMKYAAKLELERVFNSLNISSIRVDVTKPYLSSLAAFFKSRAKRY